MEDVQQLTENLEIPNSFTQELTDILTTTTSDDVAHIPSVFHGENERGRSTYINTNVHSDSRAASTSSPPPPPSSASSSSSPLPRTPGLPTNQELVVGPTYISYLRQLMTGLGDPTAAHSGLIPVTHISSGAHAWVCRGTIHEESICARTFCAEGASCFALKYGRMCI